MQRLFIGILFYLINTLCVTAQDSILNFIDDDKKEFFRNNGWELYYGSDNIEFYDYVIQNGDLVIAERVGENYKIHFLNESRLIEKSKSIKGNNHIPGLPKLYIDQKNIAFAPMQKFECRIIPEKERLKKKNRLLNWNKRRKGEFFNKYLHYRDYTFYSFASLDRENGFQKTEIQYGKDEKNLSTLYVAKIKSDYLSYSNNADRIEIEFLESRILLVDNFNHKFLAFDFDGNKLYEVDFSQFEEKNTTTYLSDARLRKDPVNDNMYLIFHKDLYQITGQGNTFQFEKIIINGNIIFSKSRVYDNYLYNLFSLDSENGRAIYRKKLE
ncbi:hypothetical protein MATR_10420 [Marivirga tractuosa]|uniref:Uncharacterized protein n=1 Tax=Marivirga tractuosa (strain ATCC 23168 / DSM 4126 / NBRC 15989 / NCIMB 1408 / VKM B-1430 / H-43) TaxID=643867 RepID=E4TM53_MARTH|nr:hypothetical protein [Marivirga tractuosa]ADR21329.1 hypothetical protein Ftrac_1339 [Marivirga tractuosa DSM 4126]BDD14217.1 hypothetical protein MATR_10420 [Marivirga tractuosa]